MRPAWPVETGLKWYETAGRAPDCPDCGRPLKHATISFGQALDPQVLEEAADLATSCDLLLALGSSLVVQPAAGLPRLAAESGAKLVIVNRDPTPLDHLADLVLRQGLGDTLSQADRDLREAGRETGSAG